MRTAEHHALSPRSKRVGDPVHMVGCRCVARDRNQIDVAIEIERFDELVGMVKLDV